MRFHALDGLRGLCALTVALLHLYTHMNVTPPDFIAHSFALVDFFFVLSGFVLAHAFFESLAARGEGAAFAIRRVGRLYPLHFFILGLFVVVEIGRYVASLKGATLAATPFSQGTSVPSLLSNLALAQALGLHDGITWNFPAWSISVEFWVNMLFAAVLALPLSRAGQDPLREKTRLVVLLALAGGVATFFAARVSKDLTFDYGLLRCIYGFFLGVAAQRLRAENRDLLARWPRWALAAAEVLVTLVAIAFIAYGERFWLFMLAPPLFALATLIYAREQGPVSRLLLTRPFHAFGEWSYSIYMVHAFLLVNVLGRAASVAGKFGLFGVAPGTDGGRALAAVFSQGLLAQAGVFAVYVALVLGVSALTFRFIERPGRSWFNALAARGQTPARRVLPA
ncbi:hypothetical protein GGD83_001102 [Rhodoblastus sphagnicola]|nr:acyltransferase [Rhodoblastus sphagnicola]MBB4197316.1 hypothetical protein [Rhodoblastus sphagnicola]